MFDPAVSGVLVWQYYLYEFPLPVQIQIYVITLLSFFATYRKLTTCYHLNKKKIATISLQVVGKLPAIPGCLK